MSSTGAPPAAAVAWTVLVKEIRFEHLSGHEEVNAMLEAFDEDLNRRFAVEPAEVKDLHRRVTKGLDLADVFVWESIRTVHNDWTVRYQNRWYQITGPKHRLPPARGKVTVRRCRRDQRGARLRTTPGADPSHAERPAWRPDDLPTKAAPPPSPPGSLPGPHTTPKLPRRITPTYQPKGTLLSSSRWGHFYRVLTGTPPPHR
ncbi:MAG: hypothetical protein IH936_10065 [Acidobacteria bacterium]|nr:hypothetical protein [Acidobacteriota bacterium]